MKYSTALRGKSALSSPYKLSGERLVVAHHEGGATEARDHLGDGVRLPGSRGAEQDLVAITAPQPSAQLFDRLRLVAARCVG